MAERRPNGAAGKPRAAACVWRVCAVGNGLRRIFRLGLGPQERQCLQPPGGASTCYYLFPPYPNRPPTLADKSYDDHLCRARGAGRKPRQRISSLAFAAVSKTCSRVYALATDLRKNHVALQKNRKSSAGRTWGEGAGHRSAIAWRTRPVALTEPLKRFWPILAVRLDSSGTRAFYRHTRQLSSL